jgi:hypothetical protein
MVNDMAGKNCNAEKIVFPHIMKTGGTSIIQWMQRHYHFNEISYHASAWTELLCAQPEAYNQWKFIRGHYGSGILNIFGMHNGFTPIALLRDPVERVISHYWHLKSSHDAEIRFAFVKEDSFTIEDFLEHPNTQHIISNYQTANLSAILSTKQETLDEPRINKEVFPLNIESAKQFLDICSVVGVTEDLNSFMLALSERFGFFPDNALPKIRSNIRPTRFSEEVITKIRSLNDMDYELYNYAHTIANSPRNRCSLANIKENPNTIGHDKSLKWVAGMPYWGTGWGDIMPIDMNHIWSIRPTASIQFGVNEGENYTLVISVFRFVATIQEKTFAVSCNGNAVSLVRISDEANGGPIIYAAELGQLKSSSLDLTFTIGALLSFAEINDADPDRQQRGIALHSLTLLASGAQSSSNSNEAPIDISNVRNLLGFKEKIYRSSAGEPTLEHITSQLCTASQFFSESYAKWCKWIDEKPKLHRKQWEFVYILEALHAAGMLSSGKRGLGFGCGKEPLPAVMAAHGCIVLATDLDLQSAHDKGWTNTNEHSSVLEDLYRENIINKNSFNQAVTFRNLDMNNISDDLRDFDYTWSACAFEHLGSIERGVQFVLNSTHCLRSGGVAVHTTEFNLGSNSNTLETESCVLFRKRDIEELINRLEKTGCSVLPLNLTLGERVEDGFVDLPPYKPDNHLKLVLEGHLTTSIGLIIYKN